MPELLTPLERMLSGAPTLPTLRCPPSAKISLKTIAWYLPSKGCTVDHYGERDPVLPNYESGEGLKLSEAWEPSDSWSMG